MTAAAPTPIESGAGPDGATSPSRRMDRALRLYRKRIARCRTPNQVNRVHIAIANYMTPAEARHFRSALAADPAESPGRQWIMQLTDAMPTHAVRPFEFERRGLSSSVTCYTAGVSSRDRKTLIIGFAGALHRLMLPTAWLLDCLNPALYDVVVLRDFSRRAFAGGIRGLGADFPGALANLRAHADPKAYRKAISLGTSAGGFPAIIAAILLGLDRAVSVGPQDLPQVAALLKTHGLSDACFAALLASRPHPFPEVLIVCGADNDADVAAATALERRVPARLLKARGCAVHGVLGWQHAQGRLAPFLAKILGQSLEERAPAPASLAANWVVGSSSAPALRPTLPGGSR
jgi:hypothetical protein